MVEIIMKNLKQYITEEQSFLVNKKPNNRQDKYEYHPKDKFKLFDILINLIENNITDFNCIDVSEIDDMSWMFNMLNDNGYEVKDIDISEWDVSNVTDMSRMFYGCERLYSLNLSSFNTSNVTNMREMFSNCCSWMNINNCV